MTLPTQKIVPALVAFVVLGGVSLPARAADPIAVGANAPAFSLPDQTGKTHTLAEDNGKVVLLAFYPADFTGGCTVEAHSLTAAYPDLKALGVQVYGVSVQDSKSHQAFCTKEGIPYTLLADTDKKMAKDYGVLSDNGAVAKRVTFIIGKDGKVAYVDPNVNSHLTTAGADWVKWIKDNPALEAPSAPNNGGAGGRKSTGIRRGTGGLALSDLDTRIVPAPAPPLLGAGGATPADDGPTSIQSFHNTADNVAGGTRPVLASLGKAAPGFTLTNVVTGKQDSLDTLRQGKKATVLMFISTRCPICNAYTERFDALVKKYGPEGVQFVGINANSNEPIAECKQHATENNFLFPVLKDAANKVADAYDARVTPETFVIDANGNLVYYGRIDNDVDPAFVKTHALADALTAVVAGKPVVKPTAKAFGCSIKRAE